jgi:cobalt-zinc-cadmium efflux system outer membrane protein
MVAAISLPIPSFNTNRGEIQRASAERDVAAFELAAQERAAGAQVAGAAEAARILTDRVTRLSGANATEFLARADEVRRIALGTYREGAIPLFQVIDATRAWADARITYYTTLVEQHRSVLSLLVAEGTDLFALAPSLRLPGDPSR